MISSYSVFAWRDRQTRYKQYPFRIGLSGLAGMLTFLRKCAHHRYNIPFTMISNPTW